MSQRIVTIENGQGIITIASDGFADCIKIRTTQAATLPDCQGSSGMYYAASTLPTTEREYLTSHLNASLQQGDDEEVLDALESFLQLFSAGDYIIHLYRPDLTYEIVPDPTRHVFHSNNRLERLIEWYYPKSGTQYIFTILPHEIDSSRVDYYKAIIQNGGRPKVVVYGHTCTIPPDPTQGEFASTSWYTGTYVIDGHHKLLAYYHCKVAPAIAEILKTEIRSSEEHHLIFNDLLPVLDTFLQNHIIEKNPQIVFSDTETDIHYNALLDAHLHSCLRVDTDLLELFIKANTIQDKRVKDWLAERFAALEENLRRNERSIKAYYQVYRRNSNGQMEWMWEQYTVISPTDLEEWKKKLFNNPIP